MKSSKYLILTVLFLTSCATTTKYKFPSDIKGVCEGNLNQAKNCIQSKNTKLEFKAEELKVIKVPGEKKFASGWGWRSPEWNGMWVLGLTYDRGGGKYEIKIGCNPTTQQDIAQPALLHEFGHFWLMSNRNDGSHNGLYSSCFWNWNEPRTRSLYAEQIQHINIQQSDGTEIVIHYIPDVEAQ